MPTVASEGPYRFVVYPRENQFEPPHVHVFMGGESLCRIELLNAAFMDDPPPGRSRDIRGAYQMHAEAILQVWVEIHGSREGRGDS